VSWTLCYEVAFYILVGGMLAVVGRRSGARAMLRGLHVLTFLCIAMQLIWGFWAPYPFNLWPQFGLGVLVYDILATPKDREPRLWGAGIVVAEVILLAFRDNQVAQQPLRLSSVAALLFVAALLALYRIDGRINKQKALMGLSWIGGFSYSLYLTHFYVLRIALQLFEKSHIPDPGGVVGLLVGTGVSVGFAALFYRFCEKPFLKKRPVK
jgi:exopolysaccharide production protein ExoZ